MASCPSCNKFCGLELQDPELNGYEVEKKGEGEIGAILNIQGSIRIVRNSECCGEEIKEGNFDFDDEFEVDGHKGEGHEFEIDEGDLEPIEEGGSRYKKSYYGVTWMPEITCSCGQEVKLPLKEGETEPAPIEFSDKMAASEMDDLV